MNKFEARKKMLAAESEMYRQLLKLEIQTFRIYGARTKRKLTSVRTYLPWVMSAVPMLGGLFRQKKEASFGRFTSLLMMGWKAYQQFAPLFGGKAAAQEMAPTETAAEEYLSDRL